MPLLVPGPRTTQGTWSNQRVAIWRSSPVTWGTDELMAMPRDRGGDVEALEVEQLGQQHGVLVGGAGGHGGEPPVMGQAAGRGGVVLGADAHADALVGHRRAVVGVGGVETDHRLGVAHVDDQQHGQPSLSRPSRVGDRRASR